MRSLSESLRTLGERTAGGVQKARVIQVVEGTALVQAGHTGAMATSTTDEPIHAGDAVWAQPTRPDGDRGLVIHGRR